MHAAIRILSLLVYALSVARSQGWALVAEGLLLGLGLAVHGWRLGPVPGLWAGLRRVRWLALGILLVYLLFTPGVPLVPAWGHWSPTLGGLTGGGERVLALLFMVSAVNWLLAVTPRAELVAGLLQLLRPLRWLGLDTGRFALRFVLTLEYIPRMQARIGRPVVAGGAAAGTGARIRLWARHGASLFALALAQAEGEAPVPVVLPRPGRPPAWQWPLAGLPLLCLWLPHWLGAH